MLLNFLNNFINIELIWNSFFLSLSSFFYYNNIFMLFYLNNFFVFWKDNYILTWIIFITTLLFIDILFMYLWNKLYKKKNYKFNTSNILLFIYTYIFRFIPILCHIWSFLSWMNKNNFKKNWLFLVSWYIFYIVIWYYFLYKIDYLSIFFK